MVHSAISIYAFARKFKCEIQCTAAAPSSFYFFFAAAAATSTASLKIISHDGFSPWEKQFVSSVYFYLQKSRSAFAKIKEMIKVSLETAPLVYCHCTEY